MMRPLLTAAVMIALVCGPTSAQEADLSASLGAATDPQFKAMRVAFCQGEWPADFVMQKHCQTKQAEAQGKENTIMKVVLSKPTDPRNATIITIYMFCAKEWTKAQGLIDRVMLTYCLGKQIAAFDALEK